MTVLGLRIKRTQGLRLAAKFWEKIVKLGEGFLTFEEFAPLFQPSGLRIFKYADSAFSLKSFLTSEFLYKSVQDRIDVNFDLLVF